MIRLSPGLACPEWGTPGVLLHQYVGCIPRGCGGVEREAGCSPTFCMELLMSPQELSSGL